MERPLSCGFISGGFQTEPVLDLLDHAEVPLLIRQHLGQHVRKLDCELFSHLTVCSSDIFWRCM
ncbi:MAG: hypothetical protein A2498_13020 [Lentisphaerae bacterium RIFOXYC12_FULL_60_16]|nr:MAG: hypothetical protein A2498_13020 [Lentisphaerae bacterium RIFOXYC12_FULL_60_16]OGV73571.1 MAG: hypothetical protein A2269_01875 [Lentisphaerae bacterium RIFOXYA12_FULL_60_10]OGV85750.1 MAG: hypothetical protein A2340_04160 [Lentisphaerae bacterium RIFOXYB12_FULL_60_10]